MGIVALWRLALSRGRNRATGSPAGQARQAPAVQVFERTPGAAASRRMPLMGANFEALSIQICHHPCQAARELRSKRFLAGEVPDLPLPGCDRKCHCSFAHHHDRRDGENRRAPYLSLDDPDLVPEGVEAREGTDRRNR